MTVAEMTEKMDAPELMEWLAYFTLQDEDKYKEVSMQIEAEKSDFYHATKMRQFLNSIRPSKTKKTNGAD